MSTKVASGGLIDRLSSYTQERIPGSGIRRSGVVGVWEACADCGAPIVIFPGLGDPMRSQLCTTCEEDREFEDREFAGEE